jgi:hypothetical protein
MSQLTFTTTVSELNRLFGVYYDATCGKDPMVAEKAWNAYVQYVRRYKEERGLHYVSSPLPTVRKFPF